MQKILTLTAVFLCAVSFVLPPTAYAAEKEKILVSGLYGAPSVIRKGKEIPAALGLNCRRYDRLKTDKSCHLDISMNGVAGCRLLESSQCTIEDSRMDSMQIKVDNGNVILNLKKLPKESSFQVETPNAVATVRGTQFWGRVNLNNKEQPVSTFAVREGEVLVYAKPAAKNFLLKPGEALDIPQYAETMPSVRPALTDEMQAMEQAAAIKPYFDKSMIPKPPPPAKPKSNDPDLSTG